MAGRGLRISADELRTLLVDELELLDRAEFDKAVGLSNRLHTPLEQALTERARIPTTFLLEQVAQAWRVRFLDLKVGDVSHDALYLVTEEFAHKHLVVPFRAEDQQLHLAMWDPRDVRVVDEIERLTKLKVIPYLAPEMAIRRAHLLYKGDLRRMLERALSEQTSRAQGDGRQDDKSTVELVTRILEYAAVTRASDIHIEPYELEALVRYRIDGALREVLSLPPSALPSLVARVKILSGMRIDERRAPQDGRFEADLGGLKLDLRVSSLPTHWGEKLVLRVLSKDTVQLDLEHLGLAAADYAIVLRNILRPFGMILITGPTGSGKSTTLYAMLIRLGAERQNVVNISTIEDPVEYTLPRVNQTAVNMATGVDFSAGLRALLRQDPDIIMVGEIRDRETVEIAVRAALVGRLLLSTLHTNDATTAVPRLLDMGIEPFLLASTLTVVIAQRLVRRICVSCRESIEPEGRLLSALRARPDFEKTVWVLQHSGVLQDREDPLTGLRLFRGRGCAQCHGAGFRGRLGLFELLEIADEIRAMIMERKDASAIRTRAVANGMKTMFQDGLGKALLGETTLEEVLRVAV